MDKDKALKLALEALEEPKEHIAKHRRLEAIAAIKEALAQEQEPVCVAFMRTYLESGQNGLEIWKDEPLYTTPPQRTWVGLTDEEIAEIEDGYIVDYRIPAGCGWNFAKDIEAKLKGKNT